MLQVYMGGNSFPQALLALSYHMVFGGCYVSDLVSEHPARPRDPERPSVWTSALSWRCLQWTKPTGLLHYLIAMLLSVPEFECAGSD